MEYTFPLCDFLTKSCEAPGAGSEKCCYVTYPRYICPPNDKVNSITTDNNNKYVFKPSWVSLGKDDKDPILKWDALPQ